MKVLSGSESKGKFCQDVNQKEILSGSELLARSGTVFGSDSGSSKKKVKCVRLVPEQ